MSREKPESQGGLQLQTLLISAVSAVAAATIVPLFWQRGTIIATAMTPVIVALTSEALRRPAQRIKQVAPSVTRRTATGAAVRRFQPEAADTRHPERVGARGAGPERFEPLPPGERDRAPRTPGDDPFGLRRPASRRNWWKAGLATGAVAFVIAAVVVTASELAIFGGSVSGGNERTSLFGGTRHHSSSDKGEQDKQTSPDATPTATSTPQQRQQATPTATATPSPTLTPTATVSPQSSQPTATPTP